MTPDYKKKYKQFLKKNFEEFDINDKKIIKKVESFCEKFDFEKDVILKKIQQDNYFRAWFVKDPAKQNIFEKTFFDFLKNIKGVKDARKLSSTGNKGTVYIVDQVVYDGQNLSDSLKSQSKSVDFIFKYKDLDIDFYLFHKYTNESGGAQDNQKNDIIKSIETAHHPKNSKDFVILFICDGDYYDEKKMEELSSYVFQSKNFYLLKSEKLEEFLENFYISNKK